MKTWTNHLFLSALYAVGLATTACQGPSGPPEAAVDYRARIGSFPADGAAVNAPQSASETDDQGESATGSQPVTASPSAAPAAAAMSGMNERAQPDLTTSGSSGAASVAASTPSPTAGSGATLGSEAQAGKGGAAVMPTADSAGASMTDAVAGTGADTSAAVKATMLTVEFTTKTYGGMYGPPNVGVVWIEDARGKWVYTLEQWCGWLNTINLPVYAEAGGTDYCAGIFPGTFNAGMDPPADVITGATLPNHKTHTGAHWTFKNSKGAEVPDGMYKLRFEFTEEDDPGKLLEVPFMKGAPPGDIMIMDTPVYVGVKIALQ